MLKKPCWNRTCPYPLHVVQVDDPLPCSATAAFTVVAQLVTGKLNLLLDAECRFVETQLQIIAKVRSPRCERPPLRRAPPKRSPNPKISPRMSLKSEKTFGSKPLNPPRGATDARVAVAVILGSLLTIAEYGVRLSGLLEFLFSFLVAGVAVGMVLHRQLAVSALDFLIGSAPGYAQNFVIITPCAQSQLPTCPPKHATIAARNSLPLSV